MAKLKVCDPIVKQQVLDSIKFQGLTVSKDSKQLGVHHKTIYYWLSQEGTAPSINSITVQTITSRSKPKSYS